MKKLAKTGLPDFLLLEPTGRPIFSDVVHGKKDRLKRAIEYFYQLTVTLSK